MNFNPLSGADVVNESAEDVRKNFALSLLSSGVPELKQYAGSLITKSDLDSMNAQVILQ